LIHISYISPSYLTKLKLEGITEEDEAVGDADLVDSIFGDALTDAKARAHLPPTPKKLTDPETN